MKDLTDPNSVLTKYTQHGAGTGRCARGTHCLVEEVGVFTMSHTVRGPENLWGTPGELPGGGVLSGISIGINKEGISGKGTTEDS